MADLKGNAQTLRLMTQTLFHKANDQRRGINPTRAALDSVLKYKEPFNASAPQSKHFIYAEQAPYLDFVHDHAEGFTTQSLECTIMDFADDTAYFH